MVLQANYLVELWFLVLIKKSMKANSNLILLFYRLCHVQQLTARASNPQPAGQKWLAKGFKMAHERFLRWLVD